MLEVAVRLILGIRLVMSVMFASALPRLFLFQPMMPLFVAAMLLVSLPSDLLPCLVVLPMQRSYPILEVIR